ncbi:MAG: hypothetical protein WDO71_01790 [Bacteroidota bacterium]
MACIKKVSLYNFFKTFPLKVILYYFYASRMKHPKRTYHLTNVLPVVLMFVTLLWLTVSTPFVSAFQQQQDTYTQTSDIDEDQAEDAPFSNTTEEKTETGFNSLSEYLHHIDELSQLKESSHKHNCSHSFSVYVAFHGELLCPPPNFTLS